MRGLKWDILSLSLPPPPQLKAVPLKKILLKVSANLGARCGLIFSHFLYVQSPAAIYVWSQWFKTSKVSILDPQARSLKSSMA